MTQKIFFGLLFVLLTACGSAVSSTPTSSEEVVLLPFPTSTVLPSLTQTEAPPSVTPSPTTDPNFFRDEFNGSLNAQWSWVREDSRSWSLADVPGALQIDANSGYVQAHNNPNLLLRPAPTGNFQIETQLNFVPADNFQFAGLIIYESDSNFIKGGRAYCSAVGCVGDGLYMDYYKKGVAVKPDFGQAETINPVLLRLSRKEDTYTFEASANGKVWFILGSHTSDIQPRQIGLVTGQKLQGKVRPALFEYFEVRSLP